MNTTIKAAITTRSIKGKETYEAEYDGISRITLYKIETLNTNQEQRTYITGNKDNTITGWAGLAAKMEELINHHLSPHLKELKTTKHPQNEFK